MRITVSSSTYALSRNEIEYEERGDVALKGKGSMPLYLVKAAD